MKPQSRHPIHMGINFITSPPPIINSQSYLEFQRCLISRSVEFTKAVHREHQIEVVREAPAPIRIMVGTLVPQPIGQLLIVAPHPSRSLEYFIQEAEYIAEAFSTTWPAPQRQIIKRDVTLRDLYETTSERAFQELWEKRLGQAPDSLAAFGRPVLGGGLRFVMPPQPGDQEPVQIEVKIESFLRDTSKIYVETQFVWPQPTPPGMLFDPRERLLQVNDYIQNQVLSFIMGDLR